MAFILVLPDDDLLVVPEVPPYCEIAGVEGFLNSSPALFEVNFFLSNASGIPKVIGLQPVADTGVVTETALEGAVTADFIPLLTESVDRRARVAAGLRG